MTPGIENVVVDDATVGEVLELALKHALIKGYLSGIACAIGRPLTDGEGDRVTDAITARTIERDGMVHIELTLGADWGSVMGVPVRFRHILDRPFVPTETR